MKLSAINKKKSSSSLTTIVLIALWVITGSTCVNAQSNLDFSYSLTSKSSINPVNDFDTTYAWCCLLQLSDTLSIDEIGFKMGDAAGDSNLVNHRFVFDEEAYLPNGLGYSRDSNQVVLHIGNFKNRTYYIEVQLKDTLGNYSDVVKWDNF